MLSFGCPVKSAEPESAAASGGLLSRNGIGELFQQNTRNGALETRCQTGKGFWLLKGKFVPNHRTAENGRFEPILAICCDVSERQLLEVSPNLSQRGNLLMTYS